EADERRHIAAEREIVGGGIADVDRDCVLAVLLDHRPQAALHFGVGLRPGDLAPLAPVAYQRRAQAIGIVVKVAEHGALRTDEALAPDVLRIGADAGDATIADADLEPAHRLAEGTGAQVRRDHAEAES